MKTPIKCHVHKLYIYPDKTLLACMLCMLILFPHNLNLCLDSQQARFLWNIFEAVQKLTARVLSE